PSDAAAAGAVATRLRLSNPQRRRLVLLAEPPRPVDLAAGERAQRRALRHLGLAAYCDIVLLRGAAAGEGSRARALLAAAPRLVPPAFPLQGGDAVALGVPPGPRIGALVAAVEAWWEEGDFAADRAACLARLRELIRAEG